MIGTTLDKYEVQQKVGEGGMATVYRGRHATLDRDVAIKVLHPHLSSSSRNRKRFAREARAIEHLHHDNIIQIYDYSGIDADDCYIITEFVSGRTLTEWMEKVGRMPSELVSLVGVDLCKALEYAHHEAILHRDIKPDNVMIRYDGRVKLMDFGIARFLDESHVTMTGALVGSPAFMSPEQAREEELDIRSDLFSLGTVLFYLVTGHLPFLGSNPSIILKNVIEGNRPSVSELAPSMSPTLADVIEQLLATSPEDRFNDASSVRELLEKSLFEAGIELEHPFFNIRKWTESPDSWSESLQVHLQTELLQRGRELLEQTDHLAALRVFNRLLSMDEDNEQVLALVQDLHGNVGASPTSKRHRAAFGAMAVLAMLLFVAAGTWIWFAGPKRKQPIPTPPTPTPTQPIPQPQTPKTPVLTPPSVQPAPVVPTPKPPAPAAVQPVEKRKPPKPTAEEPTEVAPPAPIVPEVAKTGFLKVTSGKVPAKVYTQGRLLGSTRSPSAFELPVGTWSIEIRHPFMHTETRDITIGPGEESHISVALSAKPATVHFVQAFDGSCAVFDNNVARGDLASIGYSLSVGAPMTNHFIQLKCSNRTYNHRWMQVPPDTTFPPKP